MAYQELLASEYSNMTIINRLEELLDQGRDDAMLRFGLGSALFNDKQYEQAIKHFEKCIEHDADYSAAYKLLGKALFSLGRYDDARLVFERGWIKAEHHGDKQTLREMEVFLKKIQKLADSNNETNQRA